LFKISKDIRDREIQKAEADEICRINLSWELAIGVIAKLRGAEGCVYKLVPSLLLRFFVHVV
jgi:hypothetical protein